MNKHLPERPDLEHLKDEAKALLQSLRNGDSDALARAGGTQSDYRLADAQRILAREYGHASWAKLKQHVEGAKDRRMAFFQALRGGDRTTVARILDQEPSLVRARDEGAFGAAVITIAAERDDLPLIDLVLDRGADIDARSDWWAGSFGALDLAGESTSAYLLKKGAKITAHAAARLGHADQLREMIRKDPDVVFERGGDGQYPLHFSKTPEIVDLLVDAGSVLDARDLDHVSTAAQFRIQDPDVCKRLLERGASPDVYMAVMLEDAPLLEALIVADPKCLFRTPMDLGNPMIPQAPGFPVYTYNIGLGRPFQIAAHYDKRLAMEVIDSHSSPALRLLAACWMNDSAKAHRLASHVGDLSTRDASLLAEAAWDRRTDSIKLMLELGFNPDAAGIHRSTPLDRAAFHGFDDVIEAVLPYNPSLTVENEFGGTPLRACVYGSIHSWRKDGNFPRSVELLLEAGSPRPTKLHGSPDVNHILERYGISTS
ncbi:MAG TPA: hypothetical protein VG944_05345 [Fimbriimonas sp.]|nr:hypothetical protein [Fimbriimonas sp.]